MEWWQLALKPQVILAYYSEPPPLLQVEIHSIRLHRDGPTLEMLIDLPQFPDRPSPRWPLSANTAQAEFRFFDIQEISIVGWQTNVVGSLDLSAESNRVRFRLSGCQTQLEGISGFFDISSVTGYIKANA